MSLLPAPVRPLLQVSALSAFALALAAPGWTPATAQGAKASSAKELAQAIDMLKPGQWVWAPQIAPNGPVLVYVDLSRQVAIVYRNGVRIGASTVSTGKDGYETPTGVFTILEKDEDHKSNLYDDAPMPFMQRMTWGGVALHAGGLPGYPASHGCVRLPYEFARQLFATTVLGTTVVVEGDAKFHVGSSDNSLLLPFGQDGEPESTQFLDGEAEYRWTPEAAPEGPMTIIVSKLDQRIVVLRNGIEIGRSIASIADSDPGSHVITLTERNGKPRWLYVGLPGHEGDEGQPLEDSVVNRVRLPRAFHDAVKAALRPGTTILVTNSRVGTGPLERLTIMDAIKPAP